jgi:hypothetical protein
MSVRFSRVELSVLARGAPVHNEAVAMMRGREKCMMFESWWSLECRVAVDSVFVCLAE